MLKKLNPNFAIILSTVLWGTWWLPLRLMNDYADNNAIPLFLSFMIAGLFLLVFSLQNIHLFTKKNIIIIGTFKIIVKTQCNKHRGLQNHCKKQK